jgi:hypothetical protein
MGIVSALERARENAKALSSASIPEPVAARASTWALISIAESLERLADLAEPEQALKEERPS